MSGNGVAASRASVPQREPSKADQSGEDEPNSISPFKWWVDRDATQADANMWLDKPGGRTSELRSEFWYDQEAILSRKSSVRFRRTVDLMLPVYNEQARPHPCCQLLPRLYSTQFCWAPFVSCAASSSLLPAVLL